MVIDRQRATDSQTDRRAHDRGQLLLIGAITVAFIILGLVVIFNGVLFTETLSTGTSSQSGSDAQTTETEIRHGIGCLIEEVEEPEDDLEDEVNNEFSRLYQNSTAESRPAIATISDADFNSSTDAVTVNVSYSSNDIDYTTTLEIDDEDCPRNG